MDIEKIRALVEMVSENGIAELEVETEELSLRVTRQFDATPMVAAAPAPLAVAPAVPVAEPTPVVVAAPSGREVCSPIVGTFYRAVSPDEAPFVTVGQKVAVGDTLCIVEAMKVMNEIEAEFAGTVMEVCLEDGQPVEAEGVLFRIAVD